MIQPVTPLPTLIYAKEVLHDRIHVYQVRDEESFSALAYLSSHLMRIGSYHIFAELWVSADPATEGPIGHEPALGSMRTIFTADEANSATRRKA